MTIAHSPPKSAEVFAAFRPIDLAEALTQRDLTPSASDLFLYLHTIAPFGNFYSWNDAVNEQSIREALKRRAGKHRGKPMNIRTYQRSRKQLVTNGLVAVSKRGFRILELTCRRNNQQVEPQLNVFSWTKTRQFDRDRPLESPPVNNFSDRKDPDLDLSRSKILNKQKHPPTHLFVPKANEQKEFKTERNFSSQKKSTGPQPKSKRTLTRSRQFRAGIYMSPPVFTKLHEKYLPELESVGIPKERVFSSLINEIKRHSWDEFLTAISYTKLRQARSELPQLVSPAAYLMAALQNRYQPQALQAQASSVNAVEREWLDLAYNKLHLCYSMRCPDGEIAITFLDAKGELQVPVVLEIAQQRYPLEQLRAMVERQKAEGSGQELGLGNQRSAVSGQRSGVESEMIVDVLSSTPHSPYPREDPLPPNSEVARLPSEEIRAFIETLAPGDPDDYERDFALKLEWFRDRLQHFGCNDSFLEEWKPFQIGDVQLVEVATGWTLEVIPF